MNTEVLQQLRRVVEDAPEDLFHMRSVVEQASCGTARCALGWCIIDPWFQQNTKLNEIMAADYDTSWLDELDLVAKLFEISEDDADNLFGGDLPNWINEHAVSKQEVFWNIDEILAGRPALPYRATMNREGDDD